MGSPEYRPAGGGIVFIEDVAEAPYRIDRMLTQLLRAGWFTGVRGIVAGAWVSCGTDEESIGCCGTGWASSAFHCSQVWTSATASRS